MEGCRCLLIILLAEGRSFQRLLVIPSSFYHLAHKVIRQFDFFMNILRRNQRYYFLSMRIWWHTIKSHGRPLSFTLNFFFICKISFQTYDVLLLKHLLNIIDSGKLRNLKQLIGYLLIVLVFLQVNPRVFRTRRFRLILRRLLIFHDWLLWAALIFDVALLLCLGCKLCRHASLVWLNTIMNDRHRRYERIVHLGMIHGALMLDKRNILFKILSCFL